MDLFFDPQFSENNPLLDKSESHHCIRVLRNQPGQSISVTNGKGSLFSGIIISFDNHRVHVQIDDHRLMNSATVRKSLAVCVPKSSERIEWIMEKGTELGMTTFYPLFSENSERRKVNPDRLLKKGISACKQSHNPFLPEIKPIQSFTDFITSDLPFRQKWICHQENSQSPSSSLYSDVVFLVGPEGGFTPDELKRALKSGFQPLSLGSYILRTETAAISAMSLPVIE